MLIPISFPISYMAAYAVPIPHHPASQGLGCGCVIACYHVLCLSHPLLQRKLDEVLGSLSTVSGPQADQLAFTTFLIYKLATLQLFISKANRYNALRIRAHPKTTLSSMSFLYCSHPFRFTLPPITSPLSSPPPSSLPSPSYHLLLSLLLSPL